MFELEPIIEDLVNGKCVLFLGPELLVNKEGKYYKAYFKELAASSKDTINKYFPKENLFSVSGQFANFSRRNVIKQVSRFYENIGDEIILDLISKIPLALIINVAPDVAINKVFEKNNFTFRAGYSSNSINPQMESIAEPSISNPVIYNIFGCITDDRSLIIDHDDLFKRIKALMEKGIPINIRKCLENASSFIFLGLKFETWYYQLLLSILGIDKYNSSVRIGTPDEIDEDTVSVMNSYFQIVFAKNNPLKTIQDIYEYLSKNTPNILRTPGKNVDPPKTVTYLSYAWNDEKNTDRESFVDKIYAELSEVHDVNVLRDKNELTIQDSIESFMNRIGKGKVVIIVVSDKYLKSEYCMYEAWEVFKNNNFRERVFLVVLDDVDMLNSTAYVEYWVKKANLLSGEIGEKFSRDILGIDKLISKSRSFVYIYLFISEFLKIITDTLHFKTSGDKEKFDEDGFQLLVKKIVQKLKEA